MRRVAENSWRNRFCNFDMFVVSRHEMQLNGLDEAKVANK